ncbi:hypothetical protein [Bartonella birtlesii]|uniref:hypothetical protein n=1 Tax=Bartonella birtlesii TaxID=111504 RepID=UPI000382549B|nr:hypothetical protein [Bartonella birtlesii]
MVKFSYRIAYVFYCDSFKIFGFCKAFERVGRAGEIREYGARDFSVTGFDLGLPFCTFAYPLGIPQYPRA